MLVVSIVCIKSSQRGEYRRAALTLRIYSDHADALAHAVYLDTRPPTYRSHIGTRLISNTVNHSAVAPNVLPDATVDSNIRHDHDTCIYTYIEYDWSTSGDDCPVPMSRYPCNPTEWVCLSCQFSSGVWGRY